MYICHTLIEQTDGKNDMLAEGPLDDVELLRIALLNRTALVARLSREVEDAQLKANDLLAWVQRLLVENRRYRQTLGLESLDPPHLPPRYPDSALAKALAATRTPIALDPNDDYPVRAADPLPLLPTVK
ncbi:hypothetical protein BJP27_24220 (plasmid) [Pseudomonas oryzihabitans]|nr:hypothetical protein BJP27_24220 [Pseudomonas psychrotolerans]